MHKNVFALPKASTTCMKYGFVIKELRLLARGVIVIDKKGIIRYIEYVPEIAQEPNYEAALKAVKELE